ncbi:MAG TPA: alpha/beta hydrolase [Steroidobacteraceae bacterium]|nr:alpha/beta hydrolase [Steroidobacteraceae bacterium]
MKEAIITKVARLAVKTCLRPALHSTRPIATQRLWSSLATRTLVVPRGVRFARCDIRGVPTEIVSAAKKTRDSSRWAVLYLHGGAFIIGSPVSHRSITGRLAKLTGATVFVPDYRLAPEHPFPAAVEDAIACYRGILEQGYIPGQIAVAGDSAGGGLALSLCLRLRIEGLARPGCAALISPWADLTQTQLAPVANDPLLREEWLSSGAAAYRGGRSAEHPLISPLYASLHGLPRTLIHAASEEILRNDSRRLAAALRRAGVFVEHREYPRMWHDFQLYAGLVPDATQSVIEIAHFIQGTLASADARASIPSAGADAIPYQRPATIPRSAVS